ncbi:MAG: hypothetical protein H0Z19_07830 [Archaeoglobus sp.]|uniref:hypothetical protein n=1 Tax=Archaeoglobus sp. TaxID=1872626 RepID=UPI001D5C7255|nr:hypothetical protein [Archaeoglobus sp.]MBO8180373.1 hypothetical protein [Archaeoglobus sp.]
MNPPFLYFFIAATAAAVVLTERLESLLLNKFFKGFVDEIKRAEAELNEYYALSILAIAMNDREAYEGFQRMANEKYWPLFFRKMMFSTSLFFLLLTPYMLLTTFFIDPQAFSYIMFIAIAYFTARLGLSFVIDSFNAWKKAKETRRNFG